MKDSKTVAIILIIIVATAVVLYVIQRRETTTKPPYRPAPTNEIKPVSKTPPPREPVKSSIVVQTQKPGNSVTIQEVSLADTTGYVVIHKDAEGRPGLIIGHSALLPVGNYQNVAVDLATPMADKNSYFVMLHKDNGDSLYNITEDQPLKDDTGNIIMIKFDALFISSSGG